METLPVRFGEGPSLVKNSINLGLTILTSAAHIKRAANFSTRFCAALSVEELYHISLNGLYRSKL